SKFDLTFKLFGRDGIASNFLETGQSESLAREAEPGDDNAEVCTQIANLVGKSINGLRTFSSVVVAAFHHTEHGSAGKCPADDNVVLTFIPYSIDELLVVSNGTVRVHLLLNSVDHLF